MISNLKSRETCEKSITLQFYNFVFFLFHYRTNVVHVAMTLVSPNPDIPFPGTFICLDSPAVGVSRDHYVVKGRTRYLVVIHSSNIGK